jgi:hypothetical protein
MADEIAFSILRYRGQTPDLAACVLCELKFFTPSEIMEDSDAAFRYLLMKYMHHRCAATFPHEGKRTRIKVQQIVSPARRKLSA